MKWFEKIKTLRKEEGLTQEELSKKLGVDRSTVANWEQGRRTPDTETFIKLAKAFDVPIDCIIDVPVPDNNSVALMQQIRAFFGDTDVSDTEKEKILKDIMDIYFRRGV